MIGEVFALMECYRPAEDRAYTESVAMPEGPVPVSIADLQLTAEQRRLEQQSHGDVQAGVRE
jgi:hypothetical protein